MNYKENELYREIEIFLGDTKVGEAEIDIKNKMLSRLSIYEPYQNKQIGTKVVVDLTKEYGLTNLWVNADNERAIHVYEKCGFVRGKTQMFEMRCVDKAESEGKE
jgi:RimJ/RimL family protein N-acetyltransferase